MVERDGTEDGTDIAPAVKRKRVNGAAKGAEYERRLADYFVSLGYENARRMIRTGTTKHADEGDIDGLPFTVQAKTLKTEAGDAQLDRWHAQAREQAKTRGHLLALLVVKRNGHGDVGKSWVHVDALSLARLVNPEMLLPRGFALCQAAWWIEARVSLRKLSDLLVISYPPS
jgi:hypothetical protein